MAIRTIGFIGLGAMGRPMARRLLLAGFAVKSCVNIHRQAVDELKPEGLIETSGPDEVAGNGDALIVMVRDVPQTEQVLFGQHGALPSLSPGTLLVLMSTLAPAYCQQVADRVANKNVTVLDAPVSGLPARAESGTLTLMVGGDDDGIERFQPAFEAMGAIHRCGALGMGMVAKLANNLVSVTSVALVDEARRLAKAYGMNTQTLLDIMSKSTADSFTVRNWKMVEELWPSIRTLAIKDLDLCVNAARDQGLDIPLGQMMARYPWLEHV